MCARLGVYCTATWPQETSAAQQWHFKMHSTIANMTQHSSCHATLRQARARYLTFHSTSTLQTVSTTHYHRQPTAILFTQWSKNGFFTPQHGHIENVKIGTRTKFHIYCSRNVGIQPPKPWKYGILPINLPLMGLHDLQNCQHTCASIGSLCVFTLVAFGRWTTKL